MGAASFRTMRERQAAEDAALSHIDLEEDYGELDEDEAEGQEESEPRKKRRRRKRAGTNENGNGIEESLS